MKESAKGRFFEKLIRSFRTAKKQFLLILVFVNIMFKVRERVRQDRKTRTQTALVNAVSS